MKVVVIGSGIAGLLAARVLSDAHDVVVLERDEVAGTPEYRSGVPQSRHVHGMLARGTQVLEELFPGLCDELVQAGAHLRDVGEMRVLNPVGWLAGGHTGFPLLTVSRQLLESRIRRRVPVEFSYGVHVTGLSFNGSTVDGVLTRNGRVDADLVVDASGRSSKLASWLADAGIATPEPTEIDSRTGYATRVYEAQDDFPVLMSETLDAPSTPRGAIMMRIEGGRVMVTAQGAGGDHPSRDPDDFQAFLESVRGPFARMLKDAEPVTPIYLYSRTASRRTAFERTKNWPGGLVALGDSVCALNPAYGQGMTVAALAALRLRELTDAGARSCRRFQKAVAAEAAPAWGFSSSADQGWAGQRAGLLDRVQSWYIKKWFVAITHDTELFTRFFRVVHMLATPASLMNPLLIWRVVNWKP